MNVPGAREFKVIYEKSGISTLYTDYVKRMALITSLTFILAAVSSTLVHSILMDLPASKLILVVFSLSIIACGLVAFALLYYPLHRRNQMRGKIEDSLAYTLSYMTVLSAGGISFDRIMERVSEVEENPPMKQLAEKFMVDIRLLGFDVASALKDVSRRSPSEALAKLMNSVNNTMQTRGDLKGLLTYEFERHLQRKRDKMKRVIGTQNFMGEVYITLMVVAPVLFILMLTILSVLGSPFGISSVLQLNLLVFFGIPVIAIGLIIILDTILRGEE